MTLTHAMLQPTGDDSNKESKKKKILRKWPQLDVQVFHTEVNTELAKLKRDDAAPLNKGDTLALSKKLPATVLVHYDEAAEAITAASQHDGEALPSGMALQLLRCFERIAEDATAARSQLDCE